ncbi:DUF819 domain-containing protein [Alkalimonas amylolytica]|uniref:Uncharacterized membrane protein n=1 Tax=Alkalimonas amylolytica TaxID=152573 RepID=A0A1H3XUS8_ALKAM|nr:DUF819 family protein [Alkalimonas amylolytica]SEA03199.1 Uncharacterized membrane protein [Alkalimonas amylolytica]
MITDGFLFLTVLLLIAAALGLLEKYSGWRLFTILPGIVLLYFGVMLASSLGLWSQTDSIRATYSAVRNNLLPAMIFLMLLKSDLRAIAHLGPRMLGAFFTAVVTIMLGFVITFALFHRWLEPDSWKTFAALSGSWMGGTGNMAAIQSALDVPDSRMGYTLLMDSIDYAIWVMILLALVPFAGLFNRWTKADSSLLAKAGERLALQQDEKAVTQLNLLVLLSLSFLVSAVSQHLASWLPTTAFLTTMTWTILLVTLAGVLAAMTRLGKLSGSVELSQIMLLVIIALIASRADFADLAKAPIYVTAGLMILCIHGVLMALVAKLFRLDLFTCGVASLANIGGVASAPILAAAYSKALIPVGVLMAMLGYVVGTAGGLLVGKMLSWLA